MVVGESSITLIDGLNGQLFFRGYDVSQFAGHAEYLAVVHLLWHGRWPTFSEQADLDLRVRARRSLPSVVSDLLPGPARWPGGPQTAGQHGTRAHHRVVLGSHPELYAPPELPLKHLGVPAELAGICASWGVLI